MIADQPDLYAALRQSGIPAEDLPRLLSDAPAPVAQRLAPIDKGLLRAVLRAGLGQEAVRGAAAVVDYLKQSSPAALFSPALDNAPNTALPTRGERPDMPAFSDRAFDAWFATNGATYGLGLYGENRSVYATPQFADTASPERRTIHLGIDVFAPAGTPVYAPYDGKVHVLTYNADPLDYGHTLILEHRTKDAPFFTLYGHLGGSLARLLSHGAQVTAGQHIADLGDWHENGGWAPHLHFQIITDMLEQTGGNFFGVGQASLWDIWQQISPDPNLILRLPAKAYQV
ncbi:peptidoglycan DD-metalloendopeptidase family protein [Thioclava sp. FR2]|uniref:peptidoglycan DD-metalloendopeptidase family protein n=1 Tax=Thioclava sp. FR2 TaxID=3445780 RepID=UPI003EBD2BB5